MRSIVKATAIILFASLAFVVVLGYIYFHMQQNYEEMMRSATHVVIIKAVDIEGLVGVDINMCDSITSYTVEQLNDTISENIPLSDEVSPCSVKFVYHFSSGESKTIPTGDFDCHGCEGSNSYYLYPESIKYFYRH